MTRRTSGPGGPVALVVSLALLLAGCAWSNRANRPVWNAFEDHLVPKDTTTFYATLPLTVPAGLACILVDSFVVHPVQVADDAWADAGDLWNDMDWEHRYYSALASLPFRAVGTPIVFVLAFLGRSLFDFPPHGSEETATQDDARAAEAEAEATRERALLERLHSIAQAPPDSPPVRLLDLDPPPRWTDALGAAFDEALARGRALDRLALHSYAQRHELPPWRADPARGLRDRDPVVRYVLLERWPADREVPADLREALRDDPDEAVRQLARQRWP